MQPDITVNKIPLTLSRFPCHAILFTTSPHKCIHCLIIQHRGGYFAYTAPPCMRTRCLIIQHRDGYFAHTDPPCMRTRCLIIQYRGGYFAYTAPPCMRTCRLINAPVTLLTELRQIMRVG